MSGDELRTNPYVGLRPFIDDDSLYFYGREQQIAELLGILRQHRFLAVVGSSGSGKSSLVRAGLLPGLLGGFLVHDRDRWRTVQIKPGDAPIGNLAEGLLKAMELALTQEAAAALEHAIREGHTDAVVDFLAAHLGERDNLFLLVDQFEEIFAFRGDDDEVKLDDSDLARRKERTRRRAEGADFVDLLLALAERRELPIYVALTMRTDFLGECDLFYGLPEALNRGRYLVPRLTREQLRDAVECPALLLGAEVAPRLLDHVLNELGDRGDRLPVLQHALLRTWDVWDDAGRVGPIDLAHFTLAGGLEGALNKDAERALAALDQEATARVFKRLTDTDASQRQVRSPARISELMTASGVDKATVERIVDEFRKDGRSFVHQSADGRREDPRVDISHESLIRQWDSLKKWVEDERASRDQYKELCARARKWKREEVPLLHDPELRIISEWRAKASPSSGWAARHSSNKGDFECALSYLDESVGTHCRELAEAELGRRWRRQWSLVAALVTSGLVAAGAWGLGYRTIGPSSTETRVAEATAGPASIRINGLQWTTHDRRQATTWSDAEAHCRTLRLEQSANWRLPTAVELLDIHEPEADELGRKLKKEFRQGVSADYLWSSESDSEPPSDASRLAADFRREVLVPLPIGTKDSATALCVTNANALFEAPTSATLESRRSMLQALWNQIRPVLLVVTLLTTYFAVSVVGRWLQRKLTFDNILRDFSASGGRNPIEAEIEASRQMDAVTVHHTAYALPIRRAVGWGIDLAVYGLLIFFAAVAIVDDVPRVTVTTADGKKVTGDFVDWPADEIQITAADGTALTFSTLSPPEPEHFGFKGGEFVKATLPTGEAVEGWGFLTPQVRVPEPTGQEWYGTLSANDETTVLKYSKDDWQRAKNAWEADLQWRFGSNVTVVREELAKWTTENPPPAEMGERKLQLRGNEVEFEEAPTSTNLVVFLVACLVIGWLYEALQYASARRATLGMRLVGIFRTDLHGKQLSFGRASAWYLLRLGSFLTTGLGFVVQPFTKQWQTWHDRLAGSVVLRRPRPGAEPAAAPSKWHIRAVRVLVVGVYLTVLLILVGFLAPTDGGSSALASADPRPPLIWDKLGLTLSVEQLSLNGQPLPPADLVEQGAMEPIVVAPGSPLRLVLASVANLVPPQRCPDGGCPVRFASGYQVVNEPATESAAIVASECGQPPFHASGIAREEPFGLDHNFTAPTEPGRYDIWFDFTKGLACGSAAPDPEQTSTTRHNVATIEVK